MFKIAQFCFWISRRFHAGWMMPLRCDDRIVSHFFHQMASITYATRGFYSLEMFVVLNSLNCIEFDRVFVGLIILGTVHLLRDAKKKNTFQPASLY